MKLFLLCHTFGRKTNPTIPVKQCVSGGGGAGCGARSSRAQQRKKVETLARFSNLRFIGNCCARDGRAPQPSLRSCEKIKKRAETQKNFLGNQRLAKTHFSNFYFFHSF